MTNTAVDAATIRRAWALSEPQFDSFREYLRFHRRRLDVTQGELADKAGIGQSYVSGLERGINKEPTSEILEGIARAIERPTEEVFRMAGKVYTKSPRMMDDEPVLLPSGRKIYVTTPSGEPMDLTPEDLQRIDLEFSLLEQRKKAD